MGPQAIAGLVAGIAVALLALIALLALRLCQERELRGLEQRQRVLEGQLVVVNTPAPDDQSIEGVVELELENGLLVLRGATYLEREDDRGRAVIRRVPAGEVVIAGPKLGSWVQRLHGDRSV